MDPGTFIPLVVAASVIVVSATTLFLFRFCVKKLGVEEMVNEGIVLTENGVEYPLFLFMGKCIASYAEIEFVELVPFPKSLTLRLRYGPSVASQVSARWDFCKDTVVIKFKQPRIIQYHLFKPNDPAEFFKQLKSRIDKSAVAAR